MLAVQSGINYIFMQLTAHVGLVCLTSKLTQIQKLYFDTFHPALLPSKSRKAHFEMEWQIDEFP